MADNGSSRALPASQDRACALRAEPATQSQAEPLVPSARASYDQRSDVLYVSLFDPPQPAVCVEADARVLFRFNDCGLVGVTILDFVAQGIEARRAETHSGSVACDESAVGQQADAPEHSREHQSEHSSLSTQEGEG